MGPRIGISGCLLDREHRPGGAFTGDLGPHVDWAPYAAEIELGLGALWETWRLTGQGRPSGHAATGAPALPLPPDLDGYVIKAEPYGGPGEEAATGRGLFAAGLRTAFPLLPVEDDERLEDPVPRERFVERIFARARLRALFTGRWRPRDLVDFHTRHKLQILAHDPVRYRQAGRIVAQGGRRPRGETEAAYRRTFGEALAGETTRGRNANAMQHAFSQISERLDDARRHDVLDKIRAYQSGELPLSVPIALLSGHATGGGLHWTAEQTYLAPYPADLCLRDT